MKPEYSDLFFETSLYVIYILSSIIYEILLLQSVGDTCFIITVWSWNWHSQKQLVALKNNRPEIQFPKARLGPFVW